MYIIQGGEGGEVEINKNYVNLPQNNIKLHPKCAGGKGGRGGKGVTGLL